MSNRVFFLFVLAALNTAPAWAYIDPGTGSLLFSALSGIVVTLYFFFKGLWLRIKTLPARLAGRGRTVVSSPDDVVVYTEGRQYWNVFRPILEELVRRGQPVSVFTADPDDPVLGWQAEGVRATLLAQGPAGFFSLNALEARVCLATTPSLDVYHWKRSPKVGTYVHVLHAPNDVTLYRVFGLDYYDVVLVNGDFQVSGIRELESRRRLPAKRLVSVGSTYLDVLAARAREVQASLPSREGLTVLVSPSWGESGLLRRHGLVLLEPLAAAGLNVIVRPHPQTRISEAPVLEALQKALEGRHGVEWDFDRDNVRSLARADVMISDFSGIIFDFAFVFGRPVLYTSAEFDLRPYDAADLAGPTWTFQTLPRIGRELRPEEFSAIGDVVRSLATDPARAEAIRQARAEAWPFEGEAARRTADVVEELLTAVPENEKEVAP